MDQENIILHYLEGIPGILTNPVGLLAVIMLVSLLIYSLFGKYGIWITVCMILLCGIQGRYTSNYDPIGKDLIPPLEAFRDASKAIFALMLGCLTITAFWGQRGHTGRNIGGSVIALFFLQQFVWFKDFFQGSPTKAAGSMVLSFLLAMGIAVTLTRTIKDMVDIRKLFRAMEWAGLFFCVFSLIQIAFDPSAAIQQGRLRGISANPQFAAVFLSILIIIITYLLTVPTEKKLWRIFHFLCWGFFVVMLMWTGSRTGLLIAFVGVVFQVRNRPLVWVLGGLVVAGAIYYLSQYSTDTADVLSRLTSTADTRSEQYAMAWENFANHPVFGNTTTVIENCYLAVASGAGIVGLAILAAVIFLHLSNVIQIWRLRKLLGTEQRIADLLLSLTMAMGVGGLFEGFVLAIATAGVVLVILLLTVSGIVRQDIDYLLASSTSEGDQPPLDEPQMALT